MNARLRFISCGLLLAFFMVFASTVATVTAQSPTVEWESWNAQITAYADSQQLDIAETQVINITDGQLNSGQRDYTQPVNIQGVYLALNNNQPVELREGSGPGTYSVNNSGGDVTLEYRLPDPALAGDQLAVQINYNVDTATAGVIDWFSVPGGHDAPVGSSTVTLNFPNGQAPDASLVRAPQGATVSVSGNSIIIQSKGTIAANQPFEIQAPYGSGVGAAGNNGSTGNVPSQPVPAGSGSNTNAVSFPGVGSILGIVCLALCAFGVLALFGGGTLISRLFGGLLGGGRGTPVGGGARNFPSAGNSGNSPFGGIFGGGKNSSSSGRGFRSSSNQNREVPTVESDKGRGGGETFK